jgi:hypothetical protein
MPTFDAKTVCGKKSNFEKFYVMAKNGGQHRHGFWRL